MKLSPSQMKTVRHQFDSLCRKVLREESHNYKKQFARRAEKEVNLSELSETELSLLYVMDEYPSDSTFFDVLDYGLVIALPNGRPCEETVINNAFRRLKKEANLPNVVFHSLRHSSTTYKLKLNHGDLKATQGDTGHSQVDMITKIYAHILDEDRKVNAQKFESAFYANPDLRSVHAPQEEKTQPVLDAQTLLSQLQQSPELLSNLTSLILAQAGR